MFPDDDTPQRICCGVSYFILPKNTARRPVGVLPQAGNGNLRRQRASSRHVSSPLPAASSPLRPYCQLPATKERQRQHTGEQQPIPPTYREREAERHKPNSKMVRMRVAEERSGHKNRRGGPFRTAPAVSFCGFGTGRSRPPNRCGYTNYRTGTTSSARLSSSW